MAPSDPNPTTPPAPRGQDLDDEMEALLAEYAALLPARIRQMEELWASLQREWNPQAARSLYVMVHKLAGTGTSFGFPAVTTTARALEGAIQTCLDAGMSPGEEQRVELGTGLNALKQAATEPRLPRA